MNRSFIGHNKTRDPYEVPKASFLSKLDSEKVPARLAKGYKFDFGGQIRQYDVHMLFGYGFLRMLRGSTLSNRTIQVAFFSYLSIALVISVFSCPGCETNCSMCFLGVSVTDGFTFGSAVAFLLSFFISTTLNRWWDTSKLSSHTFPSFPSSACTHQGPK